MSKGNFQLDAFNFSSFRDEFVTIRSKSFVVGDVQIPDFKERINDLKNLENGDYQLFSPKFLYDQLQNNPFLRIANIDNRFLLRYNINNTDFCVSQVNPSSFLDCSKWRVGGIPKNSVLTGLNPTPGYIINDYRILLFVLQALLNNLEKTRKNKKS